MLFNSYLFIFLFLPIVLTVFYTLNNKELSICWLVGASFFFYSWWNYNYLILFILSLIFNYYSSIILINNKKKHNRIYSKLILCIGIFVNLSILGYYKYFNFFIFNINNIFNIEFQEQSILLPLAISFYTFQQIAFLIDTYKSETCRYSLMKYCLFVSFFPQLIAGPIVRQNETINQFQNHAFNRFNYTNISIGLTIFTIGLFKKVVIADGIAPFASFVFDAASNGETIYFIESWCGALSYTFQLYFDFSGYSDMAIGLGRMLNIKLPLNFFSPYRCISIIDFWKQWHITLSFFLRDYLYIPLGGNRKGHVSKCINIITTMLLGGLWHGAGWTFVIWGALHGLYLAINHSWRLISIKLKPRKIKYTLLSNCFYFLLTFVAVTIGWVFFRSDNLFTAQRILFGMIGLNGVNLPQGYLAIMGYLGGLLSSLGVSFNSTLLPSYLDSFCWISVLSIISWSFPNTYEFMMDYTPCLNNLNSRKKYLIPLKWRPSISWSIIISLMFTASLLYMSKASEFLYFNF